MIDDIGTSSHYEQVREFHEKAGCTINETPTLPSGEDRLLRAKLILEECLETVEALGFAPRMQVADSIVTLDIDDIMWSELGDDSPPDLVGIADGCADISVVTAGTLISCGIQDLPLLAEVDKNNLAKFGPGGRRREDGKWLKPPDHKPPEIERILREMGWEG